MADGHEFSLARYRRILTAGLDAGYAFRLFDEPAEGRTVYLRHDVDNSLTDALTIARIEAAHGVRSTFMVLLRSQNYNALAGVSVRAIRELAALGHRVGLHFSREPDDAVHEALPLTERIIMDARLLGEATGLDIDTFSFHNPTGKSDYQVEVPGMLNAYAPTYFSDIKYLSESNFRWREGCPSVLLASGTYEKLQILVHPMTYCDHLTSDRDALLYFLWRKLSELSRVNQVQNATLSTPEGAVPVAEAARHILAREVRQGTAESGLVHGEHRRRASGYRRDEDAARMIGEMNALLGAAQDYPPAGEAQPSLWVFGLPRSGTTLTYQVLASCLEVGYVDNLAARFWNAPVVGAAMSRSVLDRRSDTSFTSRYGQTHDPAGPHEFGYFWQRALGVRSLDDTLRFETGDGAVDWDRVRRIVHALQQTWGSAMLSKTNYVANYLPAFSRHMPMPLFIHVERDPEHVGMSILKARREYYGDESAWWATCPPEYRDLEALPFAEQIAGQITGLRRAYRAAIAGVDPDLVVHVRYDALCADPDAVVSMVRERARDVHGEEIALRATIGEPFTRRAPQAGEDAGLVAVAAAVRASEAVH